MSDADFTWHPNDKMIAESNLQAFMTSAGVADFDTLMARADREPEWFWNTAIDFLDTRFFKPYSKVMDDSEGIAWTKWCIGGTTNLALNCIDKHKDTPAWSHPAVDWEGEDGARRTWTYEQLDEQVSRLANGLKALGVGIGDVVAIHMPMIPEVAAAYLAIAKMGAVSLPLFSGFGPGAIRTRLEDAEAKAVICADAMPRAGKVIPLKPTLDQALEQTPSVTNCIVYDHMGSGPSMTPGRDTDWASLLDGQSPDCVTEQLPADAMLTLAYTSGTTGKPKGVIATHSGFLIKTAFDIRVMNDLKASDRLLWMSDFGWVVGTMTVTTVFDAGATLVMADGAPDHPSDRNRILRLAQDMKVTYLGVGPTLIRSFMKALGDDGHGFDLSSIRVVTSSGEPWTPDAWNWCQKHICGDAPLLNISGGTEISGLILTSTVIHPNKPCGFTCGVPGMGAAIFDTDGQPAKPGELGELVLTRHSIGLTQGLWRDPDRYIKTYWSFFPDVWRHGDWAVKDEDGIWFIHGRSDDTINIAGKRAGPTEIEALLMGSGKVLDAAAVAIPDDIKGVVILAVCIPMPGIEANGALAQELSNDVVAGLGPPFRPKAIVFVDELPKTRNMKTMRRVVRAAYLGDDPGDLSSLVNPTSVAGLEAAFSA